jgi:hypothetical protein
MFMNQPSNACDDLDHIEDILYMVAQRMVACCTRLAEALMTVPDRGMVLVGNAVLGHGWAAGLS